MKILKTTLGIALLMFIMMTPAQAIQVGDPARNIASLDEPTFEIELESQLQEYINYTENPDTLAKYNSIHFDATLTVLSDSHVNVVFELTPRAEQIAERRQFSICWAGTCQQPVHGVQSHTDNVTYDSGVVDESVQFSIYPQVSDDDEPPHIPVLDFLMGDYTFDIAVYDADNPDETRYEFELNVHDLADESVIIKPVVMPESHKLLSNYPNPFNPSTTVRFVVEQAGPVNITVYDILGRTVAELVNTTMNTGAYSTHWNAKSSAGVPLPSGSYWVMLNTPSQQVMHRIVLIR